MGQEEEARTPLVLGRDLAGLLRGGQLGLGQLCIFKARVSLRSGLPGSSDQLRPPSCGRGWAAPPPGPSPSSAFGREAFRARTFCVDPAGACQLQPAPCGPELYSLFLWPFLGGEHRLGGQTHKAELLKPGPVS